MDPLDTLGLGLGPISGQGPGTKKRDLGPGGPSPLPSLSDAISVQHFSKVKTSKMFCTELFPIVTMQVGINMIGNLGRILCFLEFVEL